MVREENEHADTHACRQARPPWTVLGIKSSRDVSNGFARRIQSEDGKLEKLLKQAVVLGGREKWSG